MKKETKELTKGERSVVLELSRPFNIFFTSTELHPASQCSKIITILGIHLLKTIWKKKSFRVFNLIEVIGTVFFLFMKDILNVKNTNKSI